jgi:hypothetical protein
MYETSRNQLHPAEEELDRMKQYLNEVLKEVAGFRKKLLSNDILGSGLVLRVDGICINT